jgi:hypothetical protein
LGVRLRSNCIHGSSLAGGARRGGMPPGRDDG